MQNNNFLSPFLILLAISSSFPFFPQAQTNIHAISLPPQYPPAPAPSNTISPAPAPAPPPTTKVFNVLSFGAVGDGSSDDTQPFKLAWDIACSQTQPSLLLAPIGYSFFLLPTIFTGPCTSPLVFQIDGSIVPPDGPESWPRNASKRQWLVFYRVNGMLMQGGGVIDGRGEKWWNLPCKSHKGINGTTLPGPCDSPVTIRFFMSKNLTVLGLHVTNSPQFHFRFDGCQNVKIEMLSIKSPALSPNTDGIHIENTNDVLIYNSVISNGDDCVSIGAGCHNVAIKNITCGPSHGISIGSLGSRNSLACVSNITVTDSVIRHSDNGVRIKTWQGGHGSVTQLTFNNNLMETVRNPIIIDQYYCLTKKCSNQTSAVYISDVFYTNIKGTYDVRSPPVHFACSDSVPCTNLQLSEIELVPAESKIRRNPFCWNAYGTLQTVTTPPVHCLMEGTPPAFMAQNILDNTC